MINLGFFLRFFVNRAAGFCFCCRINGVETLVCCGSLSHSLMNRPLLQLVTTDNHFHGTDSKSLCSSSPVVYISPYATVF